MYSDLCVQSKKTLSPIYCFPAMKGNRFPRILQGVSVESMGKKNINRIVSQQTLYSNKEKHFGLIKLPPSIFLSNR